MSYFSCSLEGQKRDLEPYLAAASRAVSRPRLKIALLLGTKGVGRERSCEVQLSQAEMSALLGDLDVWARGFPAYAGIVLETNKKMPRYDLRARP